MSHAAGLAHVLNRMEVFQVAGVSVDMAFVQRLAKKDNPTARFGDFCARLAFICARVYRNRAGVTLSF